MTIAFPVSAAAAAPRIVTADRLKSALATLIAVKDAHPEQEGAALWIRHFAGELKQRREAVDEIEEARRLLQ